MLKFIKSSSEDPRRAAELHEGLWLSGVHHGVTELL